MSGAGTPQYGGQGSNATPQMSSRGRILKPAKPYTTPVSNAPPRQTSSTGVSQQRAAVGTSTLNPNAQPRMPGKHQLSNEPGLPLIPLTKIIDNRYQACYSTYPTRMRLGTSMLMQPSAFAGTGSGAGTGGGGGTASGTPGPSAGVTLGKRARQQINYAEFAGFDESDDDSYDSSDTRRATPGVAQKKEAPFADGKSYLGSVPPTNLVTVQPVKLTKYPPMYEELLESQADQETVLVPVQIDLDVDTFKIRDSFMWNINERVIDPKKFAEIFCSDLDLPANYIADIEAQITEQIEEQTTTAEIDIRSPEEEQEDIEKDLRVIVNLDVQIGPMHLQDRLEWDLSSSLTPELFAATVVRDLGLPASAGPIISYALHEELLKHKKTIIDHGLLAELVDGGSSRRRGAKKLEGVWRDWQDAQLFAPRTEILTLDEMDKLEAERERASRRAKRDRLAGRSSRRR